MSEFDHCQPEVVLCLVFHSEWKAAYLVCLREEANLVEKPEQLQGSLDVAVDLVEDVVVVVLVALALAASALLQLCQRKHERVLLRPFLPTGLLSWSAEALVLPHR